MNIKIGHWYLECIQELRTYFKLEYDEKYITWILIYDFILPEIFLQKDSPLLIKTPGVNIDNFSGFEFYLDVNLKRLDGIQSHHIFENHGYNDLSDYKYSKLSFHLNSFNPRIPAAAGDTIFDICQSVYHFLGNRWR